MIIDGMVLEELTVDCSVGETVGVIVHCVTLEGVTVAAQLVRQCLDGAASS